MTTGPALVLHSGAPDETRALAGVIAGACRPGDVLLLSGDLGAGKTTFAQGFGAGLGVSEAVTSPTFTLVRQYPLDGGGPVQTMLHADVWRLDHLHEIVDLGLGELVEDGGVALVEWGEAADPVLGADALAVDLVAPDNAGPDQSADPDATDDQRVITLRPTGAGWSDRWDALCASLLRWQVAP